MALLAKVDIKNAFCLLPIYPGDFELLGIYINGAYYIDKCLPFGCSKSCKIFETLSTFLEWAVKFKTQLDTVHHYLDDFIFIGKSNPDNCSALMHTFQDICSEIGVPLNEDKTIEPTTKLTFLCLENNAEEFVSECEETFEISTSEIPTSEIPKCEIPTPEIPTSEYKNSMTIQLIKRTVCFGDG